jgi:hypothetical protein
VAASSPDAHAALEHAWELIQKHRDGAHCRAAFAAIDANALSHKDRTTLEVERQHCEMLVGNCAAAQGQIEAILLSHGEKPDTAKFSAKFDSEYWCRPDDPTVDADTRRTRLLTQVDKFPPPPEACDYYVKPVRAFAKEAGASDPRGAAIALTAVAKCMSEAQRCDEAHALLKEAQKLLPALDETELTMDCR